ncbi:MAG: alpha/beta hydrolase [Gemmatimonadaceae bacterium]|nr:alpha/beta hydrolase [Gemmatimonadaceae bacterium]MCW5827243.1 alpha/beta hydrolase [Gemmatimonadaceae bacterium]
MLRTFTLATGLALLAPAAVHAQAAFTAEVSGRGTPVLFIPGLTNNGEVWRSTAAEFARDHEVHVLSLAGFAGAPPVATDPGWLERQRDAIVAYIRERRLDRPVLVGHSLGGVLALWIAVEHPELPSAVVNIDGLPFIGATMNPDATAESMRPMAEQMRTMMSSPNAKENYLRMQGAQLRMMVHDSAAQAMLARHGRDSDMATMAVAMYDMWRLDLRADLARVRVPVLNLHAWIAYESMGQTRAAVERLMTGQYATLADATLRIHDQAYHFIMLDEPEWTQREMRDFLARVAAMRR